MKNTFYVYEHWRPDKDICFYVGKGQGGRAYKHRRWGNRYYNNIVDKLARLGLCTEVRIVQGGLIEAEAFLLEIERIAFWKSVGVKLTNKTDGGEGVSGHRHSNLTKIKMRLTHASPATQKKRRAAQNNQDVKARHLAAVKAAHNRPETKEKHRATWDRPEIKARHSALSKASHAKADMKAKHSAAIKAARARPEVKEKHRISRASPETQKKIRAIWECPGAREKHSVSVKAAVNRPETREKYLAAMASQETREKLRNARNRPDRKEQHSAMMKSYWVRRKAAQTTEV